MKKQLLIIGSAKAATSSLHHWLGEQPGFARARRKEPRFYCDVGGRDWTGPHADLYRDRWIGDRAAYEANFEGLTDETWALDGSTDYLWFPGAFEAIARSRGRTETKLVAVVRDPIDRAVSEYNHTLRDELETESFARSVELEPERRAAGWHPLFYHRRRSTIADDLARYREAFGDDLLILDYADLRCPDAVVRRICAFVGTPYRETEEWATRNESRLPRSATYVALSRVRSLRAVWKAMLPKALRRKVRETMTVSSRAVETVSEAEKAAFRATMRDEIDRCLRADWIPTENWRTALATS